MFDVTLNLVIVSIDLTNNNRYILSIDKDKLCLPQQEFLSKDKHPLSQIHLLCKEYVNLDVNWIHPTCIDCKIDENNKNQLNVYYVGMVPLDTSLRNSYFIPYELYANVLPNSLFSIFD